MRPSRSILVAVALGALTSCSSGTGGGTQTARSGPRNELTQAQLLETNTSSVYDAIRRLRSDWLRVRGTTSTREGGGILVYIDGVRAGGLERLEQISVTQVTRVRFVNARDATTRWGTGHSSGVIEVLTR